MWKIGSHKVVKAVYSMLMSACWHAAPLPLTRRCGGGGRVQVSGGCREGVCTPWSMPRDRRQTASQCQQPPCYFRVVNGKSCQVRSLLPGASRQQACTVECAPAPRQIWRLSRVKAAPSQPACSHKMSCAPLQLQLQSGSWRQTARQSKRCAYCRVQSSLLLCSCSLHQLPC
jgi:hypothetical protein